MDGVPAAIEHFIAEITFEIGKINVFIEQGYDVKGDRVPVATVGDSHVFYCNVSISVRDEVVACYRGGDIDQFLSNARDTRDRGIKNSFNGKWDAIFKNLWQGHFQFYRAGVLFGFNSQTDCPGFIISFIYFQNLRRREWQYHKIGINNRDDQWNALGGFDQVFGSILRQHITPIHQMDDVVGADFDHGAFIKIS